MRQLQWKQPLEFVAVAVRRCSRDSAAARHGSGGESGGGRRGEMALEIIMAFEAVKSQGCAMYKVASLRRQITRVPTLNRDHFHHPAGGGVETNVDFGVEKHRMRSLD